MSRDHSWPRPSSGSSRLLRHSFASTNGFACRRLHRGSVQLQQRRRPEISHRLPPPVGRLQLPRPSRPPKFSVFTMPSLSPSSPSPAAPASQESTSICCHGHGRPPVLPYQGGGLPRLSSAPPGGFWRRRRRNAIFGTPRQAEGGNRLYWVRPARWPLVGARGDHRGKEGGEGRRDAEGPAYVLCPREDVETGGQ